MYRHERRAASRPTTSRLARLAGIAILVLGPLTANAAEDAAYPTKPIRIIVGSSPGGSTDTVARTIVPKMSEILGQQLVVDNRAGAAGNIAALAVKNPDQIRYATGSYGGSTHLIVEDFLSMAKIKMFQVPYKEFGPAITSAVSGEASVLFGAVLSVYPLTRDGRLRALGVTSAKRLSLLPDIPAIAVPGYEAINWSGLSAPARTPAHIIKRLHATMVEALKDPTVAKRFSAQAADPAPSRSPEEFGAMIRSETRKWAKVAKEAGIQAE
jgi:tripartite-type tricarboxylate transporter receptor subunit TctC